ncbi:hypothetical protein HMPREF1421_00982, partial [Helicobacter pylori GAM265BSii]
KRVMVIVKGCRDKKHYTKFLIICQLLIFYGMALFGKRDPYLKA